MESPDARLSHKAKSEAQHRPVNLAFVLLQEALPPDPT